MVIREALFFKREILLRNQGAHSNVKAALSGGLRIAAGDLMIRVDSIVTA
jgi:hypothetical protein